MKVGEVYTRKEEGRMLKTAVVVEIIGNRVRFAAYNQLSEMLEFTQGIPHFKKKYKLA
jgi:hypothetical protein